LKAVPLFVPSKNKEIVKKHRDAWYVKNKEKQIARQLERRRELQEWFWKYKRTLNCTDCTVSFLDCPEICDFHHIDPSAKKDVVGQLIGSSKEAVLREIEKCVPLCANCHRKRHKDLYKYAGPHEA